MNNEITINNQPIPVKEYDGGRVVTFKDIDKVHGRPSGTASRSFKQNRKHFIEGEDFYTLKPSDFQKDEIRPSGLNNRGTVFLTESGYLMLVKSFTDELAWKVQRELVNGYFRKPEPVPVQIAAPPEPSAEDKAYALAKLEVLRGRYEMERAQARSTRAELLMFVSRNPWLAELAQIPELTGKGTD